MRYLSDGLYNYISQHNTRRFKILVLFFSISLIVLLLLFPISVFSDQALYYYTFSTIVQGFLALVALLGALVVYKLQIIETELNNTRDRMERDFIYFLGQKAYSFSWTDAIREAQKILDNRTNSSEAGKSELMRIEINLKKLNDLNKERVIRSQMVDFSLLSFLNIGLALIAIPVSKMIVVNDKFYLGAILLIINIIISFFSMISAFGIIRRVLGYDFKLHA